MLQNIQIREFTDDDLQAVYQLIQHTIDVSYREAYPEEAVEFFKDYHSEEQILNDAANGYTVVAECNGEIFGTGTLSGTNIRRVFVNPHHQQKGTGKLIVRQLEKKALIEKVTTLDLEASLVSRQFWESLGFVIQSEEYFPVSNDKRLHYSRMTKTLDIS
ncbi:MAG TPA: GNAT family N-acetyltransferase [Dehalococcoidia bacterium]|nr:GNAT family N-acetyltransferase [Dehalococcoidia bacterium]